ncbi:luciferase-like monooxygenase family protein [Mycobacterium kansasii]|uniref:Luciferase-like monooxygenase family protein n=1 Tax=Mycobacterium kansasii TaxID=1768 RepID=A0A1V3WUK3_MYCKA|nr:luciferase-like monooxygenase family protein [Mycobacterium kansasii]
MLGVGPSHHWIIDDMLGLPYERPAGYTRDYLDVLHAAFANPGPVDVENTTFRVHNPSTWRRWRRCRCWWPRSGR